MHCSVDFITITTEFKLSVHIAHATLKRFEVGLRTLIPNNMAAIRRALEDAGLEFIAAKIGKGFGVRLWSDKS